MSQQLPLDYRSGYEEALASMISVKSSLSSTYLYYAHMVVQCTPVFSTSIETAGVHFDLDHFVLIINPNFFNPLPLEQRCGILKHEMEHILFGHLARFKDMDNFKKWNYATDCALNQFIDRSHLPSGAIYPDNLPVRQGCKAKNKVNSEQYYDIIDDSQIPDDPNGQCSTGAKPFDDHGQWQQSNVPSEELQKEITKSMAEKSANETIKARGTLPSSYEDWLSINSNKQQINWQNVLRNICGNKRTNSRRTIMRQDRRFPRREDLRGKTKDRTFDLAVISDVSGSVSDTELMELWAEIRHICDVTKTGVKLVQVDTHPSKPEELKKTTKTFKRRANGGTYLTPALDMLKEHKIPYNALVITTDGGLSSEDVNNFIGKADKVLWLVSSNGQIMNEMNQNGMRAFKIESTSK